MNIKDVVSALKETRRDIKIMEVCGTHTYAIAKNGIRDMISPTIRLVSGPGCPVCVTSPQVIDDLVSYAFDEDCCVFSFGDMFRVTGSGMSLADARAQGASVKLMYSPFDVLPVAAENPNRTYVIAAVGFETTAPVYAALLEETSRRGLGNVKLYTALKTMPPVLEYVCSNEAVDAFICPGHVSVIIGEGAYERLWEKYRKPFVIAGFEPEHILAAIYEILAQTKRKDTGVKNMYASVVKRQGQEKALDMIQKYFTKTDAVWRGIGKIGDSGYILRPEFFEINANKGEELEIKRGTAEGCRCDDVILGRIAPERCPLFQEVCTPENPVGACMVSTEGACKIASRFSSRPGNSVKNRGKLSDED